MKTLRSSCKIHFNREIGHKNVRELHSPSAQQSTRTFNVNDFWQAQDVAKRTRAIDRLYVLLIAYRTISRFDRSCAQAHWVRSNRTLELCHWRNCKHYCRFMKFYKLSVWPHRPVATTCYNTKSWHWEEIKSSVASFSLIKLHKPAISSARLTAHVHRTCRFDQSKSK